MDLQSNLLPPGAMTCSATAKEQVRNTGFACSLGMEPLSLLKKIPATSLLALYPLAISLRFSSELVPLSHRRPAARRALFFSPAGNSCLGLGTSRGTVPSRGENERGKVLALFYTLFRRACFPIWVSPLFSVANMTASAGVCACSLLCSRLFSGVFLVPVPDKSNLFLGAPPCSRGGPHFVPSPSGCGALDRLAMRAPMRGTESPLCSD